MYMYVYVCVSVCMSICLCVSKSNQIFIKKTFFGT